MLFDSTHVVFMISDLIVVVLSLLFAIIFIKKQQTKNTFLKIFAIFTVVIHYSSLYVDFFTYGKAEISSTMILPIYPCNVAMWLLLIVAFIKDKESKVFRILAEFTFYLGLVGGVIGIMFNEVYANNPTLLNWNVLQGLLSHSTLLIGSIYLLCGKYIKFRVHNVLSCAIGMIGLLVDGGIIIGLYRLFNLTPPNCMFLLENPFPTLKWFNVEIMGFIALIILFGITFLFEMLNLKKEERFYMILKEKYNKGEIYNGELDKTNS